VYRTQWNSTNDWGQLAFYYSGVWKRVFVSMLGRQREVAWFMVEKVFCTGEYFDLSTGETE
jgi:hypothetical protein